ADPIVVPRGLDDAPAFADVVADRLLDVDVLAGLNGPDGRQRVPVIGRGDADDVDVAVFHDAAQILDELRPLTLRPFGSFHGPAGHGGVAVANVGDDAVVVAGETIDMIAAAAVDANDGDIEALVGAAGVAVLGGLRRAALSEEAAGGAGGGQRRRTLQ